MNYFLRNRVVWVLLDFYPHSKWRIGYVFKINTFIIPVFFSPMCFSHIRFSPLCLLKIEWIFWSLCCNCKYRNNSEMWSYATFYFIVPQNEHQHDFLLMKSLSFCWLTVSINLSWELMAVSVIGISRSVHVMLIMISPHK